MTPRRHVKVDMCLLAWTGHVLFERRWRIICEDSQTSLSVLFQLMPAATHIPRNNILLSSNAQSYLFHFYNVENVFLISVTNFLQI